MRFTCIFQNNLFTSLSLGRVEHWRQIRAFPKICVTAYNVYIQEIDLERFKNIRGCPR